MPLDLSFSMLFPHKWGKKELVYAAYVAANVIFGRNLYPYIWFIPRRINLGDFVACFDSLGIVLFDTG